MNISGLAETSWENTFVMIKPDGFQKKVFKEVMERFLTNGLSIANVRVLRLDEEFLQAHYHHLIGRSFFTHLIDFMMSGPVIAMTVSGVEAISKVRSIIGNTDPNKALPGTIRALYGDREDMAYNVIHASDSVSNALIEINRFEDYVKKLEKTR